MSLTPSSVVSSLTRTEPWRWTWAAINSRRRRARTRRPAGATSFDVGVGHRQQLSARETPEVNTIDHCQLCDDGDSWSILVDFP